MTFFIFGIGYSAGFIAQRQIAGGAKVTGTVRSRDNAPALWQQGLTARIFDGTTNDPEITSDLASAAALLVSIPPNESGDPVLAQFGDVLARAKHLRWIGYLSTVGVYGDHAGAWVDEQTPVNPANQRSRQRVEAEQAWLAFGAASNIPVHIFRLAGIYGPGRNQLVQLAEGKARCVIKPDQVFNRIHVTDIARTVEASLERPRHGAIYNVADNEPAPPQDVVAYAAQLCGVDPPPAVAYQDAEFTPMARSFYLENKRVRNELLRSELNVTLEYPTYREGLTALRSSGDGPPLNPRAARG